MKNSYHCVTDIIKNYSQSTILILYVRPNFLMCINIHLGGYGV